MDQQTQEKLIELPAYESERVREQFQLAYYKSFAEHQITRSLESPCGTLASYRCQMPGRWTYGFDLVLSGATLIVAGDIGDCIWTRERDMLAWFSRSWSDLHYTSGKVPHCIQTREFDDRLAEKFLKERLIQLDRLNELDEFDVGEESSYYEVMRDDLDDEEPPRPFDYTTEYVFCVAAVKWLIDHLAKGGA
jgi:hypothetical protein